MRSILLVAGKELREGVRNRWVVAATLLLATLALTLAFLGAAPAGRVGAGALEVVVVSLSSLSIFLLPLIALLISHDAVVGEMERGTMLLLLSYPIARWQVVLGKFLGQVAILAMATVLGYGAAGAALAVAGQEIGPEGWWAFALMVGSSVLLGAAFVALGMLASALVRDRGTAAGIAVGLWLLMVLIWDMALLGVLVADAGQSITAGVVDAALLLNPADTYRLLNLAGLPGLGALSGMAGLAEGTGLTPPVLFAAMLAWVLVPLAAAAVAFSRREL
jgi:Cu-processing system permease protein